MKSFFGKNSSYRKRITDNIWARDVWRRTLGQFFLFKCENEGKIKKIH